MSAVEDAAPPHVGSVGHILRSVLRDVIGEEASRAPHPYQPPATHGHGTAVGGAASPASVLSDDLAGVDVHRHSVISALDQLASELRERSAGNQSADEAEYAALRKRGLLQQSEVPVARLPRDADAVLHGDLAEAIHAPLVSGVSLIDAIERNHAIRSGNIRVGEVPPDFSRTAGAPHYLSETEAAKLRLQRSQDRYMRTVGGFGPAAHGVPQATTATDSAAAEYDVSAAPTTVGPAKSARRSVTFAASPALRRGAAAALDASSAAGGVAAAPPPGSAGGLGSSRGTSGVMPEDEDYASSPRRRQDDGPDNSSRAASSPPSPRQEGASQQQQQASRGGARRNRSSDAAGGSGPAVPSKAPALIAAEAAAAAARADLDYGTRGGLPGTRGQGLAGSLARAGALADARKYAGTGMGTGQTMEEIEADARVADRLRRSLHFLHNPRFGPSDPGTRLTAGARGRGNAPTAAQTRTAAAAAAAGGKGGAAGVARRLPLGAAAAPAPPDPNRAADADMGVFKARPAALQWLAYEAGGRYAATLTLRNVDSVSRHVRILPPRTRFFTMDAGECTTALPAQHLRVGGESLRGVEGAAEALAACAT